MIPEESNLEGFFTFETGENPLPEELPFHILLLGNWSGNGEKKDLVARRPVLVDRDNFNEVMRRMNVALELDLTGGGNFLRIGFTEPDDFHPDNLFRQVPLFAELRDVRRRLQHSESFESAARQVRSWFDVVEEKSSDSGIPEKKEETSSVPEESLLDEILSSASRSSVSSKPCKTADSELGRFVSEIVSSHLVKIDENERSKLTAIVDEATGNLMRTILHHPDFQRLEAAWRGLCFLVRRLETDADLKVFILDISKDELVENLKTAENLSDTFLYQKLIRETIETPGGKPFAVIGGNYSFGVNVEDIAALMRLAKLANAADAPFISYVKPQMLGIDSFGETTGFEALSFRENSNEGKLWAALRASSESQYLGLSPTRLLARLPYGKATDSTEAFSFEEFSGNPEHEKYLWINPCFACVLLLGQSYKIHGWEMARGLQRNLENLPLHVYQKNGESITKPCAETILTENITEVLLEQGLMPLISFRDSDRVRLLRFQSVSASSTTLGGRWNY